jgi:hypothetical protein
MLFAEAIILFGSRQNRMFQVHLSVGNTPNTEVLHKNVKKVHLGLLVRCFWSGNIDSEAQDRLRIFEASICPYETCLASGLSQESYFEFLAKEALDSQASGEVHSFFNRSIHQKVQCMFLSNSRDHDRTSSERELCACEYPSFVQFCRDFLWREKSHSLVWAGDSTINFFRKGVNEACSSLSQQGTSRGDQNIEKSGTRTILVTNANTLHSLYLPFFRESDVSCRTCEGRDEMLKKTPENVQEFLMGLDNITQKRIREANPNIVVYMGTNHVCERLYTGNYYKAVRFLSENPEANQLREVTERRHTDAVTTIGLTLDLYGSKFANSLEREFVMEKMQTGDLTWAYFPSEVTNYLCPLSKTGDGRHFRNPQSGNFSYYVVKARMLHQVITNVTRVAI